MTPQELAHLVLGKSVYQASGFGKFVKEIKGKSPEFLKELVDLIPWPTSRSENAPDSLQQSALVAVYTELSKIARVKILSANSENEFILAKELRGIFSEPWNARLLHFEVKGALNSAANPAVANHIMGLVLMGEPADELIEMFLQI